MAARKCTHAMTSREKRVAVAQAHAHMHRYLDPEKAKLVLLGIRHTLHQVVEHMKVALAGALMHQPRTLQQIFGQ